MITGKKINSILNIDAIHALYREDGKWYHHLKDFPGVLFDRNGYIVFKSREEYVNNNQLQHGQDLHIREGICTISGYQKFSLEEKEKVLSLFSD